MAVQQCTSKKGGVVGKAGPPSSDSNCDRAGVMRQKLSAWRVDKTGERSECRAEVDWVVISHASRNWESEKGSHSRRDRGPAKDDEEEEETKEEVEVEVEVGGDRMEPITLPSNAGTRGRPEPVALVTDEDDELMDDDKDDMAAAVAHRKIKPKRWSQLPPQRWRR